MSNTITNQDDIIDSRDIIERIEELEDTLEAAHEEETTEGATNLAFDEWIDAVIKDQSAAHAHECWEEAKELKALKALAEEASSSPDWIHGETLINEDYFTQYIEELINDCYEMPKEMNSGKWPYRHMSINYEEAADEVKVDYMEVDFDGTTYLIRS